MSSNTKEDIEMNRKTIGLVICLLLMSTIIPVIVIAGDENDPEITDTVDDQFGALVDHPYRIRTWIARVLLQVDTFDFIDIDSAWFYEDENEPDFLYTTLKIKDLTTNPHRAIYSVHFTCNGKPYTVGSHLCDYALNASCFVGLDKRLNCKWYDAEATYDFDTDIVTFKLNKEYIGNPQPGDLLTKTFAWTALRFNNELFSLFFSDGELIKDAAPFLESNEDYGDNYEIKY